MQVFNFLTLNTVIAYRSDAITLKKFFYLWKGQTQAIGRAKSFARRLPEIDHKMHAFL